MKILSAQTIILLLFTLILVSSCKNRPKVEHIEKKVFINYKNGKVFCEGIHLANKKTGNPVSRKGIWKFYYPNGNLSSIIEYGKSGEIINYKSYWGNGNIQYSEIVQDDITLKNYYNENGNLKNETIIKIVTEGNEERTYDVEYETQKDYYPNGQLNEQTFLEDGIINGIKTIYDENGNEVLAVEYEDGLIISDKVVH